MNSLSPLRFGFALAVCSALAYLSCAVVMATLPHQVTVWFFNSIMHGLNVEPLMRWDIPWWETIIGVLEIFVLGWLFGAVFAVAYNLGFPRK